MEMTVFNKILEYNKVLLNSICEVNPMCCDPMCSPIYPEVRKRVSFCRPGQSTIQYKI